MPVAFLVVSLVGAALTANARWPRHRDSILVVPSFFAAWLITELAAQTIVIQLVGTVGFVSAGALDEWPGWLALGLAAISWTGLGTILSEALRTADLVEDALRAGLGDDYRARLGTLDEHTRAGPASSLRFSFAIPFRSRRIEVARDITYAPGHARRHRLDVYTPRDPVAGAPVLLQIHGGAWVIGNKRQQALPLMHHLAARGWVCVAANYGLSPRATFPEHLVDVKRALWWIREHISTFGGDPACVAITGGSAGGHLVALAAVTANDPEYQPGFEDVDTSVFACIPFYGVYDLTNQFGGRGADGFGGLAERLVLKKKLADEREAFEQASPINRLHPAMAPFMVVHGTNDSLVPVAEARAFADELRSASRSPTVYLELPGAQHAFEVFHTVRSDRVVHGVHRFLAFALRSHVAAGSEDPGEAPRATAGS